MQESTGNFIPLDLNTKQEAGLDKREKSLFDKLKREVEGYEQDKPGFKEIHQLAPNEIVQIKGIDFKVMRLYPFTGKIELEMVKKG